MPEYTFLVVEPHVYRLAMPQKRTPQPPDTQSTEERPLGAGDSFAGRLERALDAAARWSACGSHAKLMRTARTASRPTPQRVAHINELINAGLLDQDTADRLYLRTAIPDTAWQVLAQLDPDAGPGQQIAEPPPPAPRVASRSAPRQRSIRSWRLTHRSGDSDRVLEIDPKDHPADRLPLAAISAALTRLGADGWTVVSTSEDRRIDDDASESTVTRVRFLLTR